MARGQVVCCGLARDVARYERGWHRHLRGGARHLAHQAGHQITGQPAHERLDESLGGAFVDVEVGRAAYAIRQVQVVRQHAGIQQRDRKPFERVGVLPFTPRSSTDWLSRVTPAARRAAQAARTSSSISFG